jgi:hypothetical protein
MRLSYGEWAVIGLSVIVAGISWLMGGALNPAGILVSLGLSLVVFYLSYRIIRRYYPKSSNWGLIQWTITIVLLGVVLSVIVAVMLGALLAVFFGGMILPLMNLPPRDGDGAALPAVQPTGVTRPTYARYGITFPYPEGKEIQELGTSETSGLVLIGPPQDQMSVTWTRTGGEPPELDTTMLATLEKGATKPGISDFQIGGSEKGSHLGHTATYVPVSYLNAGILYHGGMIWWYCPESGRVITLGVDTLFSQEYARSTLQDTLQSFTCHA